MSAFVLSQPPEEETMRMAHLRKLLVILVLVGEPPEAIEAAIDEEWRYLEKRDRILRARRSRISPFSAN
jgi:hypothetical protein